MKKPNKLFVEGKNDKHVVSALCNYYNIPENFDIIPCDSIDQVFNHLKLALMDPTKNPKIGIIVDADQSIENRFKTFQSHISQTNFYDMGTLNLKESGLIMFPKEKGNPVVGAWFMPDNKLNGMLEDFVMSFEGTDNTLMKEADSVLNTIEQKGIQKYKDIHRSKAKVHTYLAWQEVPGMPMGQAITTHVLNPNSSKAKIFVDWLSNLFRE